MPDTTQTKSLPTDKFLTVAINLLHKALLEASRTEAKKIYRELEDGKRVPLTNLRMEDGSMVRFDLTMNYQHYQGRLNYGSFRTGLTMLLSSIADTLREKPETLRTFASEQNANSVLFSVTALTSEAGKPSVLVLGADSSGEAATVELQLVYLDPSQFARSDAAVAG